MGGRGGLGSSWEQNVSYLDGNEWKITDTQAYDPKAVYETK